MKIALVSDAWRPQTNGVVRTLSTTVSQLGELGHRVHVVEPSGFRTFACPTYPEIRLALRPARQVALDLERFDPDALHIATEGPLGFAARSWCLRTGMPFTTSYHTQFPEYLRARAPIPLAASYAVLRHFHAAAVRTLVATPSLARSLEARGFRNVACWGRGVDGELFRPQAREDSCLALARPIWLYFGRVAVEKGIDEFLRLDLPGTRVVIGDGPARAGLEQRYPDAVFTGYKYGQDLARHVASADVCVFPSRTDTFGLVLLEAMACGLPIAAYPVTGPIDVVRPGVTGVLCEDLGAACRDALHLDRADCRAWAERHTWEAATQQLLAALAPRGDRTTLPSAPRPRVGTSRTRRRARPRRARAAPIG